MDQWPDQNLGLNDIALLQNPNHTHIDELGKMDKKTGFSRIPKLSSFRRGNKLPSGANDQSSRESTPSGDSNHAVGGGLNSVSSGQAVTRSKSLRLPRSQHIVKSCSVGRLNSRDRLPGGNKSGNLGGSQAGRGAHEKCNGSSSSPDSSRASTPADFSVSVNLGHQLELASSTEVNVADKTSSENPFLRRRAQSFGPHLQGGRRSILRGGVRGQLKPPSSSNCSSRSNTPTLLAAPHQPPPHAHSHTSQRGGRDGGSTNHRQIRSRSSLGCSGQHGTGRAESRENNLSRSLVLRRTGSSSSVSEETGLKSSRLKERGLKPPNLEERGLKPPNSEDKRLRQPHLEERGSKPPNSGGRGLRPIHSVVDGYLRVGGSFQGASTTADLNQLAQELTSSTEGEGEAGLDGPEIKSVSQIHSSGTEYGQRQGTPASSVKVGVVSSDHTHPGVQVNSRGKLNNRTRSSSMEKVSPALQGKLLDAPPTDTVGGSSKFGQARSSTAVSDRTAQEQKPPTTLKTRGAANSRSSTPSSGRSTPVGVFSTGGIRSEKQPTKPPTTQELTTPTAKLTRGGTGNSGIRTPYRRVIKMRDVRPVGINELEGAVLMEADEYLRISHEVKALKTALLKLKREIQGDVSSSNDTSNGGTTHSQPSKTSYRPNASGSTSTSIAELNKKLEQLRRDKESGEEMLRRQKNETQKKAEELERVTSDLKKMTAEKSKLQENFDQMEKHRDLLLDKVERLHADKNKLEDRLSSLEKAQIYEGSSGWLEEVDGGGEEETEEEWGESLMLGTGKGEKTESDIGEESSEPESTAVCAGPHS